MRYFVTPEFFSLIKILKNHEKLKLSKVIWVRNIYAFASRYKVLSEKQADILEDIANECGFSIFDSLEPDMPSHEEMERGYLQ
jgi:hypothetical protein